MKYLALLFIASLLASCSPRTESKTIYIVRHAEKQLTGNDPELSIAGKARATKLGQLLSDKGIKHIFSTDYIRTKSTVEPTATAAGIPIEIYSPKDNKELIKQLKELEGNILVVGHSNTISQLAIELAEEADKFPELDESEYNFIYVISLDEKGIVATRKTYKDL